MTSTATFVFLIISLQGCGPKTPEAQCPSEEDYAYASSSVVLDPTPGKIVQEGYVDGVIGASINLSKIRLLMSSSGMTSVTMEVRKDPGGSFAGTMDQYYSTHLQLLGSATVTTGLGSTSSTTPIDFEFSSPISLEVSTNYYFILSATGTGQALVSTRNRVLNGFLSIRSATTSWGSTNSTESLAIKLTYSGCSGL